MSYRSATCRANSDSSKDATSKAIEQVFTGAFDRVAIVATTALEFVANSAQAAGRDNPVRYLKAKAPLPAEAVQRWGWVPGQAFRAVLHLNAGNEVALSVPNVALRSDAGQSYVYVVHRGEAQRRNVETGARGPARTRIVSGLAAGDAVLLLPESMERANTVSATDEETAA